MKCQPIVSPKGMADLGGSGQDRPAVAIFKMVIHFVEKLFDLSVATKKGRSC